MQTIAAECDWQKARQNAVDQLLQEHQVYYQVASGKNIANAEGFEASARRLMVGRLLKEVEQVKGCL